MMPVSELRLDPLVPVPDHVVVEHVDEPVHRDAREAALAEELLLDPAEEPSAAAQRSYLMYRSTAPSRCSLLYFAIRGFSSRSGSPRKHHHLEKRMDGMDDGDWLFRCEGREPVDEHVADAIGELHAKQPTARRGCCAAIVSCRIVSIGFTWIKQNP